MEESPKLWERRHTNGWVARVTLDTEGFYSANAQPGDVPPTVEIQRRLD
jgi:hypothetical protein